MIAVYGFGASATSFVLRDYLSRVQGLRSLQVGVVLEWIALPQFVLVPLVAWLLRYLDARLLFASGLSLIAIGSWIDTGLTHDWVAVISSSQLVEAVGLALGITSLIFFGIAMFTTGQGDHRGRPDPDRPAARQRDRLLPNPELRAGAGPGLFQPGRRHAHRRRGRDRGSSRATFPASIASQTTAIANADAAAALAVGNLVRREAYVLAYFCRCLLDGTFWVLTASLRAAGVASRPPPPNHLTPPRLLDKV